MKVYVIGKVRGANRSQQLLEVLEDDSEVQLIHEYRVSLFRSHRLNTVFYYLFLIYIIDLFRALSCRKIIYLAMNENKLFMLFVLSLFRKEVILDFYTSRLLFACGAAKLDQRNQKCTNLKVWRLFYVDKFRLLFSSKLIFLNQSHAGYLSSQFSVKGLVEKSAVIPLIVPDFGGAENFERKDNYNICWWGKASNYHGLEYIMKELVGIQSSSKAVKIFFFDDSAERALKLSQMAKSVGLHDNMLIIRSDLTFQCGLGDWLKENCDLAIGSFGFLPGSNLGIANKTLEAWSLGVPICTQATLDVPTQPCTGAYLEEPSEGALSALITEAIKRNTLRGISVQEIRKNSRALYNKNYSLDAFEIKVREHVISQ